MTTLKKDQLIKDSGGDECRVLGVCGDVVHVSYSKDHYSNDHNAHNYTKTESQLKASGYTWDTPAWEPALNEKYWYIYIYGTPISACDRWENSDIDKECRDFLGIYETKELCEAALLEIRRKLGK